MLELALLIYIAMCIVYIGFRHRHDKNEAWVRIVLAVGFPVVGLLFRHFAPSDGMKRTICVMKERGRNYSTIFLLKTPRFRIL